MRTTRIALLSTVVLVAALANTGCITVPQVKDRKVDLATTVPVTLTLHASGTTNLDNTTHSVNLRDSVDFKQAVDDAGIDASDITRITLSKIQYRVTIPDANASRAITGSINVQVGGAGSLAALASVTSAPANAVTGWITPTVNAAGVTQVNNMLAAVLTELHGGALANENVTYNDTGTSAPAGVATDFYYQVRLTFTIVGKVKTKVIT